MPTRRDGVPTIVRSTGASERLERLSLQDRQIDEGWLQQQLHEHPELLPISEIDPSFGPLIAVGREVGTPVGPIDNLYVSRQGLLTIVEAKLWRNPQARREVVGQILDYAKELARWTYDDLDARAKEASGKSLWEIVAGSVDGDEASFVDAVSRNLRAGRFLLLVVGDGIREEMESLTNFLQESPQLRFILSLVELQIYRLANDLLIVPSVLARTKELTRAVVHVVSSASAQVDVALDLNESNVNEETTQRRKLDAEAFFADMQHAATPQALTTARRLYNDFLQDARFQIDWGSGSYQIKLPDPSNPSFRFTMLVVNKSGTAYVGWLPEQLGKVGLPAQWGQQFFQDSARLLGRAINAKHGAWDRPASLQDMGRHYEDFVALITAFASKVLSSRGV